jgi:two-component system, cell cycle sensor histidine kinase and response regulator CckA
MDDHGKFALEVAGVGIWDMDFTTGVVKWSEMLERQYGLEAGTFGGTFDAFIERIYPADRESVQDTLRKARKSGADFSLKNRSIWLDGTVRWLTAVGRIYLDGHGEPLRGVGISLDVTERHELEQQHQQAQKMEAIGQMAAGVAHDFNTLLTVILGYCELLLADDDADDARQLAIGEIQKAGESAARLTRQLLAFSRKQIIEPTVLDVNVVVSSMQAMLRRLIGEEVNVVLALRPRLAPVTADRGQIEQIVMNLAMNARDAMPTGGTLTIETANVQFDENRSATPHTLKAGHYVTLTMTDTGTGMTPQVLAHLFEPFFTTKELGRGTGLGLATVYRIVERTGGTINVASEVGKGTSVTAYFPRADAAEIVVEAPAALRPRSGTETVLVVEDVDALRGLLKRQLERQGYTVLVAASAEEALGVFERNPSIDVVLTDAVMPGASGPQLIVQLINRRPDLRVIFMSGYAADSIFQNGLPNPGVGFLHKPFTSGVLVQKIREVLDR